MSDKTIGSVMGLVIVGVAGFFAFQGPAPKPKNNDVVPLTTGTTSGDKETTKAGYYTLPQVAEHASATSCWTAVNGSVYDVTRWISEHPGGSQAILGLCGKDGSSAFNDQHGGQTRPANELAGFIIGKLTP